MPDESTNHLEPRVFKLEGDMAAIRDMVQSLAESQQSLIAAQREGFATLSMSQKDLHTELRSDIAIIARKTDSYGRTNWPSLAAVAGVLVVIGGWFVSSQIEPVKEALRGEREARIAGDERHRIELDSIARAATDNGNRITAIESWDAARKLWKDKP